MSKGEKESGFISSNENICNIFLPAFILNSLKYDTSESSCETETTSGTEDGLVAAKEEGLAEGWIGSLGLAVANWHIESA